MKTLVMDRIGEYHLEEMPEEITYQSLKPLIGGWVQIALKIDPASMDTFLPEASSGPGLVIMCDEEGLLKELSLTFTRPTDGAPLVGKLYWLSYEDIWTNEGHDIIFHALTSKQLSALIPMLKRNGWGEIIIDGDLKPNSSTIGVMQ